MIHDDLPVGAILFCPTSKRTFDVVDRIEGDGVSYRVRFRGAKNHEITIRPSMYSLYQHSGNNPTTKA